MARAGLLPAARFAAYDWSPYDAHYLARLVDQLRALQGPAEVWCVFDNTASGAALDNAWEVQSSLTKEAGART